GDGVNLVLGGKGGDTITTGIGNDVVIGDNGQVDYVDGVARILQSTDSQNSTTGDDVIVIGAGNDRVI
ncbi:calcium-binding protein, partial [Vibrio genomosp. F10 str. 9ZD137]